MLMQAHDSGNVPATTRQVVGIILGLACCVAFFAGVIYLIKADVAEKRALILKNPGYATGIITRVRTYKSKRITVQYKAGGIEHSLRTRVPRNFLRTHKKGDTTAIIYSTANPASAILKAKLRPSAN